jgi:23S rRNA pseudouridine1911/1915/1917 synthase
MILTSKKGEWLELISPSNWEGLMIEQLAKELIGVPKKLLHELRMEKGIKLNGADVNWQTQVKKNDRLYIKCFKDEVFGVIPEQKVIHVLYEDEHLLIVNKPTGIDTHPTDSNQLGTLANGVAYHWQLLGIQAKVRHIHRLDRDTSGTIVFAKHSLASSLLDGMLERREIKRTYLAYSDGVIRKMKGTIREPIGRDRHHSTRRRVSPTGQKAVTHYDVMQVFQESKVTKVRLQLDTGRTHQIRVHMSHIGHPLLGDFLYGGSTKLLPHQALHAAHITFSHPITKEDIVVEAPLPNDLINFEKKLM